uniref:Lipoprotein n=1 Tax=Dictyoglomus thermophilum TaxID=14 RepID=A0A7C3RHN2_DICTH
MKKCLILILIAILAIFLSGCVKQEPQPDKDLTQDQLNNIYATVINTDSDYAKNIDIYMDIPSVVFNQGSSLVSPISRSFNNLMISKSMSLKEAIKTPLEKITIEPTNEWQGPDANGWYMLQIDTGSYLKVRYYSSVKRLEYVLDGYSQLNNQVLGARIEGYFIFNKDIKNGIDGAYPVSLRSSYYLYGYTDPNKVNKIGLTMSLENVGVVKLSNFNNFPVLTGKFSIYAIYVDFENNINIDNKLMISASSSVVGDNTNDPILKISGSKDSDGDPTTYGYDDLYLELHLSNYLQ